MRGYVGLVARVNLSSNSVEICELDEEFAYRYLGGRGFCARILYDEIKQGVDPLSPENVLVFATGPLTGTSFPSSGRYHVGAKSPLTGGIGESNAGGFFGPYMKLAGFDALIVEGASQKPVYLLLESGRVKILPASALWGKTTYETQALLRQKHGSNARVACIGPAGENGVLISCIICDAGRAAGRTGLGAVMGSKKLKAVVARGSRSVELADPEKARREALRLFKKLRENRVTSKVFPERGTASAIGVVNRAGVLPTKNFQESLFEPWLDKSDRELMQKILVGKKACWSCPMACGRRTRVASKEFSGEGDGPEYEAIWALGPMCGVSSIEAIAKANYLANELGLDAISLGNTIACAMELNKRGLLPKEKLVGVRLEFGNPYALIECVWRTAYRVGIGEDISLGAKRLAERYGAPDVAMHAKGLELPAYDPRGLQGMALAYATSNRGGCHLRALVVMHELFGVKEVHDRFSTVGKARLVKEMQDAFAVIDSLVVCKFLFYAISIDDIVPYLCAATGWELGVDQLRTIGERIYNLERLFINREGFGEADDALPKRLVESPISSGESAGHVARLEEMLGEYYALRGWERGAPTRQKLDELGIG